MRFCDPFSGFRVLRIMENVPVAIFSGAVNYVFKYFKCLLVLLTKYIFHLQGGVRCLQFDNGKIISGSWDMTIMVGQF